MKKKLLVLALVLLTATAAVGGTLAYFTGEETARNVITTGAIDITVVETTLEEGKEVPYPSVPVEAMPGSELSKIVRIKNNASDAWVRAKAVVVVTKGEEVMKLTEEELQEVITMDYDTQSWTEKDGWWYYNASVKDETAPLFTTVTFSGEEMGNEFMDTTITIDVYAQAVQTANNGATALEANGWPKPAAE